VPVRTLARASRSVGYVSDNMAGERSARSLPPLLSSRALAAQVALAVGGPVVLGALCGIALGLSEAVYLGLSLLAALGGVAAGFEHARARSGLLRGVVGGCLFGFALLAAHAIAGAPPLAKLPDPQVVLVVITTVIGALLGGLGARLRAGRERAA
jgi:hypothetical protein